MSEHTRDFIQAVVMMMLAIWLAELAPITWNTAHSRAMFVIYLLVCLLFCIPLYRLADEPDAVRSNSANGGRV